MANELDAKHLSIKRCSRCDKEKPLSDFGIDNRRDIPKAICRECDREVHRLRYYDPAQQERVRSSLDRSSEWSKKEFERKKEAGICYSCKSPATVGLYCADHAEQRKLRERENRRNNRPLCRECGINEIPLGRKGLCAACAESISKPWRERQKRWRDKEKLCCFDQYGGAVCACCGELNPKFLTIDHIEGNGADHRREIGRGSLYRWLKRHNYPPGFRVLCFNCNCGREYNGGICPHEEMKAQLSVSN